MNVFQYYQYFEMKNNDTNILYYRAFFEPLQGFGIVR